MDEPSDEARAAIASYRRARVLDPDARARVHARLLVSSTRAQKPATTRTRQLVTVAAIALATAAGVVLAAQLLWGKGVRVAEAPSRDAATYDVDARAQLDRAIGPATPPKPVAAQIDDGAARIDAPPLQRGTVQAVPTPDPVGAAAADADALAAELAHIQAARAALARGDADAALRELAAHERTEGRAQLVEERRALRIDALCDAGKLPQARAEAKQFIRSYPTSSHRARVEAACR